MSVISETRISLRVSDGVPFLAYPHITEEDILAKEEKEKKLAKRGREHW